MALSGPGSYHIADGSPSGIDHRLRQTASDGSFLDYLTCVELAVEISLHDERVLLLSFFERHVALDSFYFNSHNLNSFFNG